MICDERFKTASGRVIWIHRVGDCQPPCAFHAPSDHGMTGYPLNWREDRRIVERICPCGIGHPDPDDLAYRAVNGPPGDLEGINGCCGIHCA